MKTIVQQQTQLLSIYERTDRSKIDNNLNQIYKREQHIVIPVDEWAPEPQDEFFKEVRGFICLPVSAYYGLNNNPQFDNFVLSSKRCYNTDDMRIHICKYLNYFEKFYDTEHELLAVYYNLKYLIDYEESYSADALAYDLQRYIIHSRIGHRARLMNADNYTLDLSYRNNKNPGLQYTNKHGAILMEISIFQNMIIPILTHFASVKKIRGDLKAFLLRMYELIIGIYDSVDIINKLYETALSTVEKNKNAHPVLWNMQNIRAKNETTHSIQTVMNIILQIVPKYTYDKNIIHFNYKSVIKSTSYQVIDIGYEYNLKSLSSVKRDDDNNSEFDKYDAHVSKADEALYIQNKVNYESTMDNIERIYGPFLDEEVEFYEKELTKDGKALIQEFQEFLIFSLFYKYFGDTRSIKSINAKDYVKLVIAAKRMLLANNMKLLPYIISGKIQRMIKRVAINKKELTKIEASQYYPIIEQKYRNPKILKHICATIAALLSSKLVFIDYQAQKEFEAKTKLLDKDSPEYLQAEAENFNGKPIEIIPEFICEEVLMYIQLI